MLELALAPAQGLEPMLVQELSEHGYTGTYTKDSFEEGFSLVTTHLGLRIRSGDFHLSTSGSIVPKALPTINMAVGLTY